MRREYPHPHARHDRSDEATCLPCDSRSYDSRSGCGRATVRVVSDGLQVRAWRVVRLHRLLSASGWPRLPSCAPRLLMCTPHAHPFARAFTMLLLRCHDRCGRTSQPRRSGIPVPSRARDAALGDGRASRRRDGGRAPLYVAGAHASVRRRARMLLAPAFPPTHAHAPTFRPQRSPPIHPRHHPTHHPTHAAQRMHPDC